MSDHIIPRQNYTAGAQEKNNQKYDASKRLADHQGHLYYSRFRRQRFGEIWRKTKLNALDIADVETIGVLHLAERHLSQLPVDSQIRLIKKWLGKALTFGDGIKLLLANFEVLIAVDPHLLSVIRFACGNQPFRNTRKGTIFAAEYILKYFDRIPKDYRVQFIELLVFSRNPKTQRAIRKVFYRKFDQLPFRSKNRLLFHLVDDASVPDYYFRGFLAGTKSGVSEGNLERIRERLA